MYMVSQVHSCLFGFVFPLFPHLSCMNPPELLLIQAFLEDPASVELQLSV